MGSSGIKRRKPRRRLRRLKSVSVYDDVPPNIMWPDLGSGFEASAYSPAGSAQREWWFIRHFIGRARGMSLPVYVAVTSVLLIAAVWLFVSAAFR